MKLSHVTALVTAADHGGFRSAARVLGISQVALAKQIRELEESVGHQLFLRTTKGVAPTVYGRKLLPRARAVLSELSKLEQEANTLSTFTLTVGLSPIVTLLLFQDSLKKFRVRFPSTRLRLSEGLLSAVLPRLRDGSMDFAVVAAQGFESDGDLTFEPCFNTDNAFIARVDHPLRDQDSSLIELLKYEWVQNEAHGGYSDRLEKWLAQNDALPPPFISCESFATIVGVLLATDSIACAPVTLLEHPLLKKNIRILRSSVQPPRSTVGFLYRRDSPLSKPAVELRRIIRSASRSLTDVILL